MSTKLGATKLTFPLTVAGLTALSDARKAGKTRLWLTIAGTQLLYGAGCTKLARTTTVLTNVTFNVSKTAPIDQQPTLHIQTGALCPAEGPTTHSVAQGLDLAGLYGATPIGRDGLLDIFGPSAKFALLAGDHALSLATTGPGGYTYGQGLSSVWGNINAGMADPYLAGSPSVPVSKKDALADRAATYAAIQNSLKTIPPNGPTPLAQQLEDALDYFGPSPTMDPHFRTLGEGTGTPCGSVASTSSRSSPTVERTCTAARATAVWLRCRRPPSCLPRTCQSMCSRWDIPPWRLRRRQQTWSS